MSEDILMIRTWGRGRVLLAHPREGPKVLLNILHWAKEVHMAKNEWAQNVSRATAEKPWFGAQTRSQISDESWGTRQEQLFPTTSSSLQRSANSIDPRPLGCPWSILPSLVTNWVGWFQSHMGDLLIKQHFLHAFGMTGQGDTMWARPSNTLQPREDGRHEDKHLQSDKGHRGYKCNDVRGGSNAFHWSDPDRFNIRGIVWMGLWQCVGFRQAEREVERNN